MIRIALTVNGAQHRAEVAPQVTLLEFLRETLHLTGAKEGCGVGECGACLVLVDGAPLNSCLVLAADADGRVVETIEHETGGGLDRVQEAFLAAGAFQCGFCTPAMILASRALLRATPHPTRAEAAEALSGVLCRCGSYPRVLEAVGRAANEEEGP